VDPPDELPVVGLAGDGRPEPLRISPAFALVQVFLVCGIPTGIVIFAGLLYFGSPMTAEGSPLAADPSKITLEFFAMSSLLDTAFVALLIRLFLWLSGESSREVFLGTRRRSREFVLGLLLVPALLVAVVALVAVMTRWFPGLHNVPKNPLESYMDTPLHAGIFLVVVILAGGVREELQRGFILHRFDQCLGGAWVGLAVFSVAFGLFHLTQGIDAAIAVGLLGVLWGVLYIRRRSVVIAMTSHAGFDVAEVLQQLFFSSLGA
jgi:membrane protease YdiL (CAAX protease family)